MLYNKQINIYYYGINGNILISFDFFNPIPAGVLENQDNLTPPPLNPMLYVQI